MILEEGIFLLEVEASLINSMLASKNSIKISPIQFNALMSLLLVSKNQVGQILLRQKLKII